jgi:hypothetical protein
VTPVASDTAYGRRDDEEPRTASDEEMSSESSTGATGSGGTWEEAYSPEARSLLEEVISGRIPYPAKTVRPWSRLVLRTLLWAGVALGALGGVVALASAAGGGSTAVAEPAIVMGDPDVAAVPASVAVVAELVVEEWLVATEEDADRMAELFVETPLLPASEDLGFRQVNRVHAVSGEPVAAGYWAVTVWAEMVDVGPVDPAGTGLEPATDFDAPGGGDLRDDGESYQPPPTLSWYVEVGIVGDPTGALAALRTPAVLPTPPSVEDGWTTIAADIRQPGLDSPEADTIEGFLQGFLAGEGDPSRYLAPDARPGLHGPAEPLFTDLSLVALAVEDEDDGAIRAQAFVEARTIGGSAQIMAYELVAEWRGDRYEVRELWGAASLRGSPEPDVEPEGDGSEPAVGDDTVDAGDGTEEG